MEFLDPLAELIEAYPYVFAVVLGLITGSFLNVVIHRLPLTLFEPLDQDPADSDPATGPAEAAAKESDSQTEPGEVPRIPGLWILVWPQSACVRCAAPIRWFDNIPLLSYLILKGRCRQCGQRIAWRYPLIELIAALLCIACVYRFGAGLDTIVWSGFCLWLLTIAAIDSEHMLIPDTLSLTGLWIGLLLSITGITGIEPQQSLIGAALGYLFLYSIYWLFLVITGKEGIGYGDFKLLGMLGAWLGAASLPALLLIGSVAGSLYGIAAYWRAGGQSRPFPFGPWLVLAALILVLIPDSQNLLRLSR